MWLGDFFLEAFEVFHLPIVWVLDETMLVAGLYAGEDPSTIVYR